MVLIAKIKSLTITFTLLFSLSFTVLLYAQDDNYKGKEASLSTTELSAKAETTDFKNNISAKIFIDEKNSYFAVDVRKLLSTYEEIRILELSFSNNNLVNIGSDKNTGFYFFLVNNTLNISEEDVNNLFNDFLVQTKTELLELNEEQLRLWLIQHDKYSKK
ncbi:MAG: hypothetical protein CL661_12095 [Bacteroidetes bacterium]|jgi:hypothetical protein|nr:hypothetical protein [Bacteroidota bacterium]MAE09479.1 hypothetical protein [Bacteroidota bacterium]|tara:strand:+ start:1561 stop:2043 length:483 start_codon:yes stop_codon:yes gene_type:complete